MARMELASSCPRASHRFCHFAIISPAAATAAACIEPIGDQAVRNAALLSDLVRVFNRARACPQIDATATAIVTCPPPASPDAAGCFGLATAAAPASIEEAAVALSPSVPTSDVVPPYVSTHWDGFQAGARQVHHWIHAPVTPALESAVAPGAAAPKICRHRHDTPSLVQLPLRLERRGVQQIESASTVASGASAAGVEVQAHVVDRHAVPATRAICPA